MVLVFLFPFSPTASSLGQKPLPHVRPPSPPFLSSVPVTCVRSLSCWDVCAADEKNKKINEKIKVFKYHKMEEKQKKIKMECSVYIKATVFMISPMSFLLD